MSSAAELGISEQEYQDAINLELLYGLISKGNDRCSRDGNSPVTHVDCNTYQFLCSSCAQGRSNCKRIGDDRFKKFEVDKMQRKFGGGGGGSSKSNSYTPKSKNRGERESSKRSSSRKKSRKRSPSPDPSTAESESDESSSYHRKSSKRSGRSTKVEKFGQDDDFLKQPPGMMGIARGTSGYSEGGQSPQQQSGGMGFGGSPMNIRHTMNPAGGLHQMPHQQMYGMQPGMGPMQMQGMNSMMGMPSPMGMGLQRPPMYGSMGAMGNRPPPNMYSSNPFGASLPQMMGSYPGRPMHPGMANNPFGTPQRAMPRPTRPPFGMVPPQHQQPNYPNPYSSFMNQQPMHPIQQSSFYQSQQQPYGSTPAPQRNSFMGTYPPNSMPMGSFGSSSWGAPQGNQQYPGPASAPPTSSMGDWWQN
eukprot:GHVP01032762.1.p1 GENE.GHVP01032762.1~~GHVP01032762.1.p1  ORF type:complete len:416 (+),score=78.51 GHVP01032762.1:25-1272(+)